MTSYNQAADDWARSQRKATEMLEGLSAGDYVWRYDEQDDPETARISDTVYHELTTQLRDTGLRIESDDQGLRLVRAEEDE